jgi:SpoVK/Ycf46/Vps4 family AAA+-type ATPase
LLYPNLYPKVSKGILIYGPPGTGKTLIVKAAVNQLQARSSDVGVLYFTPSPGDLKGKYVGETEKKIEEWFMCASQKACDQERDFYG